MNQVGELARTTPRTCAEIREATGSAAKIAQRYNISVTYGRIAEVIEQTRFGSTAEWVDTIERYVEIDNQHIPQRALQHQTPLRAIETWRAKSPESCVDSV